MRNRFSGTDLNDINLSLPKAVVPYRENQFGGELSW
jgi:hypothetical protein